MSIIQEYKGVQMVFNTAMRRSIYIFAEQRISSY